MALAAGRRGWRSRIALVAIHLLVVQALLAGFSLGAHAAPDRLDAFGDAICTPNGIRLAPDSPTSPVPADAHGMSCCLMGCAAAGPSVAPPPSFAVLAWRPAAMVRLTSDHAGGWIVAGSYRTPGDPRAPPST